MVNADGLTISRSKLGLINVHFSLFTGRYPHGEGGTEKQDKGKGVLGRKQYIKQNDVG